MVGGMEKKRNNKMKKKNVSLSWLSVQLLGCPFQVYLVSSRPQSLVISHQQQPSWPLKSSPAILEATLTRELLSLLPGFSPWGRNASGCNPRQEKLCWAVAAPVATVRTQMPNMTEQCAKKPQTCWFNFQEKAVRRGPFSKGILREDAADLPVRILFAAGANLQV